MLFIFEVFAFISALPGQRKRQQTGRQRNWPSDRRSAELVANVQAAYVGVYVQ